ncbi:MAG: C40 family peptidase [Methylotetracoccus sp.]
MSTEMDMEAIRAAAEAHAAREYPREACGLVVLGHGYVPCRNIALKQTQFVMAPEDWLAAERRGKILAVVHSHPDAAPEPSPADLAACEASALPWLIVSWPGREWREIGPEGRAIPLQNRSYVFGVFDCFTLVRDYFRQELGIALPPLHYEERWYKIGKNYIAALYKEWGFRAIAPEQLTRNDVIATSIDNSPVPNHLAIYLGGNQILHQRLGRLSGVEMYGDFWQRHAMLWLRHCSLS